MCAGVHTEYRPCLVLITYQCQNCCCRTEWLRHHCNRLRRPERHTPRPPAKCRRRGRSAAAVCRRPEVHSALSTVTAASPPHSRSGSKEVAAGWCIWLPEYSSTDAVDDDCNGRTPSSGCLECETRRAAAVWASSCLRRRLHRVWRLVGTADGAVRAHTKAICWHRAKTSSQCLVM